MKRIVTLLVAALCCQFLLAQTPISLKGDALFGSMRARHLGPAAMSGRVIDLATHPSDPNVIYVGTAGGGVWRSQDGGITHKPIFDKHCQSIGAVAVDPSNPDQTIWVGTGEIWTRNSVSVGDGLYKSTDGGKNWKKVGLEKSDRISAIHVNPNNSDEVYVGVLGALWGDSEERGVYKTTDGGATWEKILYTNTSTGCADLAMDPNDPNTLYASMWEFRRTAYSFNSGGENSALYKSTDGGKSWNKIHNGFPEGKLGRMGIAVAESNPKILYTVIESEENKDKGLYRSNDGGKSWKQTNNDFALTVRPFYFSRIVVNPTNPDMVCKAGLFASISKDGGKTFRTVQSQVHADIHDFVFDVKDSNRMYLGCDGGVYRSLDGGNAWEMAKGLPISQYYHVTLDNEKPFNVYGGLQDNGSWVGPSAKAGGIDPGAWVRVGFGDGFRVYPHPADPNIVYSEMQGAEAIWRVNIDKNQSKTVKPYPEEGDKLRFNWNTPISTSTHQSDRLYVGSQYVHKSEDQGDTWTKISPDLTTNDPVKQNQEESGGLSMDNSGAENHCTIFTIAESSLDQNIIWVGTDDGNVQVTFDGGKNWSNVTANLDGVPKNTWTYHIEPSSFDKNTAYAVFDGHAQNDMKTYIQKTTDGGKTWKSIVTDDIVGFSRSIQEDFVNPNLLYLGTEFGLYITIDGGQNWSRFKNNMPAVAVHHVTLHKRDHSLVMGTHGRGVIIIDDVTPLRQLTPEIVGKKVHFLKQAPSVMRESSGFIGSETSLGQFVGDNPSSAAQIVYYMKGRHTFGKMTLGVFDKDGNKIADLAPGKAKGINSVSWNYRYKMPKIAKAKTLAFGGFTTPTVPPGVYTVKMTKGKASYESTIELISDPESIHSTAARTAQHDAAMKLYTLNEDLAYLVDQIDMVQAGVDKTMAQKLPKKVTKMLTPVANNLVSLKEPLVVMTGDNYVGAAEPQLREKIASLYGEVAGYLGKPSNAQMKNFNLLNGKYEAARSKMDGLLAQLKPINEKLAKLKMPSIDFRSREDFMDAD